jgi:hypothetical protein
MEQVLPAENDPDTLNAMDIIGYAERSYYQEFHSMVDHMHLYLRVPLTRAVEGFRDLYGITEDDFPLAASLRNYQRYAERIGRRGKRGRPVMPKEMLRAPWKDQMGDKRPQLGLLGA